MDSVSSYKGTTAVTKTGKTCQAWTAQSPHKHTRDDKGSFKSYWTNLGESAAQAKNYCRDPDNTGGLWCYTTDSSSRWEYCNVPACGADANCLEGDYKAYKGEFAQTKTGKTCQAWTAQSPHKHTRDDSGSFASYWSNRGETPAQAKNYCRDPDNTGGLWCYTTDSSSRWEYCSVPSCAADSSCVDDIKTYKGTVSVTKTGKTCQAWNAQSPHSHTRDDAGGFASYWSNLGQTSAQAKNYCRDPDNTGGLWCYTTDSGSRWEYCNVPSC